MPRLGCRHKSKRGSCEPSADATKCQKQAFWRWYGQRSKCAVLQRGFETFTVNLHAPDQRTHHRPIKVRRAHLAYLILNRLRQWDFYSKRQHTGSSRFPGLRLTALPRLLMLPHNGMSAESLPVHSDRIARDSHPVLFYPAP